MTIRSAQQQLLAQLKDLYDDREAANITDWVMEYITGKRKIDRLLVKEEMMPHAWEKNLQSITNELLTHKPVQYVLGEAWFAGMKFYVNNHVLVPRPETEELVEWVEESQNASPAGRDKSQKLIDIGTGSGCIPIAIKQRVPTFSVTGIDVSQDALQVAAKNAETHEAEITFLQMDFLVEGSWRQLPVYDIIVSNPPYIKRSEQESMSRNVFAFEPNIALFVPDEDALLFYRKILLFAKTHLAGGGSVFLEINEALGNEVVALFEQNGYAVELRKDLQGKERMVRANLKT